MLIHNRFYSGQHGYKIILPYIKIEPSEYNKIKSNDSLLLINIKKLIKEKQIDESIKLNANKTDKIFRDAKK